MQIARRPGVSEGTVRKHLENAYRRLHVTHRMAAVIRAFPEGTSGIRPGTGSVPRCEICHSRS
ncbi:LuxR C-terminal-related transcriptional regulator [Streptomyces sp. YS-3]|uniref:LuxR C-terminal-related transcriptional regulator n=1 Tax=Streptomyces sp. YS-3 TaxID=3381352 RepID=UPI00386228C6